MMEDTGTLSPAISELDDLVENLTAVRARAASTFATETLFFANVAGVVQRRESERAQRAADGSTTYGTQLGMREIYAELAADLNLSEQQVARRVDSASTLVTHFTETLYQVSDGLLSPQHAQTIAEVGIGIADEAVRAEFEQHALHIADELTAAQLRVALEGMVAVLDPEGTRERIHKAVAERGVAIRSLRAGLSRLSLDLPTAQAVGAYNRLGDIADEIITENRAIDENPAIADHSGGDAEAVRDVRTKRQVEADVAADLLLTSMPEAHGVSEQTRTAIAAIRPRVDVSIPAGVLTAAALRDTSELADGTFTGPRIATRPQPDLFSTLTACSGGVAVIPRHGPIDDDTARALAAQADEWIRVFADPDTGVPLTVDRYRPAPRQRLFLEARDITCRFPGCRHPARECDVDHTIAASDGGPTALCNLACLCERHHTLKHHTDWGVIQLPGGVLRWTTPTRRIHTTRPPGVVQFIPDPRYERDPAPF